MNARNATDLFPETLLVHLDHGQPMTDSLTVARHFGKQHAHVMRGIDRIVGRLESAISQSIFGSRDEANGEISRLRFQPRDEVDEAISQSKFGPRDQPTSQGRLANFRRTTYLDERGKRQPMYLLTKDGFSFVVHKFTGAKAEDWQWRFIDAFNALEADLQAMTQRYVHALDQMHPALRPVAEATAQGKSRSAIGDALGKSVGAVTYHRRRARHFGLLAARGRKGGVA